MEHQKIVGQISPPQTSIAKKFQAWPKHKKLCKIHLKDLSPSADTYCGLGGASAMSLDSELGGEKLEERVS
jgi:hypothetical protein